MGKRTKRQAGKMAKNKGSAFERKIAKSLQDWWNGDKTEEDEGYYQFQRTPLSGGSQLAEGWGLAGDIVTNDPGFPFHIECKKQEGWSFSALMSEGGAAGFIKWWQQSAEESKITKKEPVVIFSKNNVKPLFAIKKSYIGRTFGGVEMYAPRIELIVDNEVVVIIPFQLITSIAPKLSVLEG